MAMNWKAVRSALDRDELLQRVGLERRSPGGDFATGLGLFSIGVLVGAGLGLMFAPKPGEQIRAALNDAWRNRGRRAQDFQRDLGMETAPPAVRSSEH
jgi:gas vesicle protein